MKFSYLCRQQAGLKPELYTRVFVNEMQRIFENSAGNRVVAPSSSGGQAIEDSSEKSDAALRWLSVMTRVPEPQGTFSQQDFSAGCSGRDEDMPPGIL